MTSPVHRVASWSVAALVATASCFEIPFITETFAGEISVEGLGPLTVGGSGRMVASALYDVAASDARFRHPSTSVPSEYEWTTQDPEVATVDSLGFVRAIAVGSTAISATYKGVSRPANVHVVPPIDALVLEPTSATVTVHDTVFFEATILDAQQQPLTPVPLSVTRLPSADCGNASTSATTTRVRCIAIGRGEFEIFVTASNNRPERVRGAMFTLKANP